MCWGADRKESLRFRLSTLEKTTRGTSGLQKFPVPGSKRFNLCDLFQMYKMKVCFMGFELYSQFLTSCPLLTHRVLVLLPMQGNGILPS